MFSDLLIFNVVQKKPWKSNLTFLWYILSALRGSGSPLSFENSKVFEKEN
jgi:hypothetical protein